MAMKALADLGNGASLSHGLLPHSNPEVLSWGSSPFAGKGSVLHCCDDTRQSLHSAIISLCFSDKAFAVC